MIKKYTAADFANAQFAELGKHGLRAHKSAGDSYWQRDGIKRATNEEMVDAGWVPVPTKPTITRTEFLAAVDDVIESQYATTEARCQEFTQSLGIEITPDPEPTNTDRLEQLIRESGYEVFTLGHLANTRELAEWLNNDGVTAPKED